MYVLHKGFKMVPAIISDFLALSGKWWPVNTGVALLNKFRKNRIKEAGNILLSQVGNGDFSNVFDDDRVAMMYQYGLAAINGRANRNLMLLAQLIRNISLGQKLDYGGYIEEYAKYARILEDLTKEEITILAVYAKFSKGTTDRFGVYTNAKEYIIHNKIMDSERFWAVSSALSRTGLIRNNGGFDGGAEITTVLFDDIVKLVDFNYDLDSVNFQ